MEMEYGKVRYGIVKYGVRFVDDDQVKKEEEALKIATVWGVMVW